MEENLKRLEEIKTFLGGDNEDVPVRPEAIKDMKYIVEQCDKYSLPQPEIFPYAGGDGVQAEWEYDWYLEIDSSSSGVSCLVVKGKDYDNAISIRLYSIKEAFELVKHFLNNVVDLDATRR